MLLPAAVLLSLASAPAPLQDPAQPPPPISQQNDLAHRNPDIHWPAHRSPTDAQSFSHNEGYIGASCEKTFRRLADLPNMPAYLVFTKDVQLESPAPLAKGTKFRWTIFGSPIESEIAEYEPGRRIAWLNLASGFYQTWLLQPSGNGCRVTTEEAGFGALAAQRTAHGDVATHRAHDLWLASLRWVVESDPSPR